MYFVVVAYLFFTKKTTIPTATAIPAPTPPQSVADELVEVVSVSEDTDKSVHETGTLL